MRVAVLSKDFEPLSYCGVERAITLIYLNKAEPIKNSNIFLRSVTAVFNIPLVIRLLYKTVRKYIPVLKYSRKNIHIRDNYTCQYCGAKRDLSIDHILPVSRGGKSTWENTVTACLKCNGRKGNRTPEEAGIPLKTKPSKPDMHLEINWDELNYFS